MTRPPPNERPSARQLASGDQQPLTIAGKPADICPHCGCALFVDGVNRTDHDIVRYVVCRNKKCAKRFMSRQPPAKLIREVGDETDSAGGKPSLTLVDRYA